MSAVIKPAHIPPRAAQQPGMKAPGLSHLPARPSWICTTCGLPWLCADAKRELLAVYDLDAAELRALLSHAMVQAIDDWRTNTGAPRPTAIGERLFGWLADMIIQLGGLARPPAGNPPIRPTGTPTRPPTRTRSPPR